MNKAIAALIPILLSLIIPSCKPEDTSITCSRCGAHYDSIADLQNSKHTDGSELACDDCGAPYAIMLENSTPPTIGIFFDTNAMSGGILTPKQPLVLPKLAASEDTSQPLRYEYSQIYGGVTYRWVISYTVDREVILQIDHLKCEEFELAGKEVLTGIADLALEHTSEDTAAAVTLTVTYADRTVTRTVNEISEALCNAMNEAENAARLN